MSGILNGFIIFFPIELVNSIKGSKSSKRLENVFHKICQRILISIILIFRADFLWGQKLFCVYQFISFLPSLLLFLI